MAPVAQTHDPSNAQGRRGILAGGNFIIDHVKVISDWPEQDALATIRSESMGNGGGPYNLLKDLAAMGVDLPLAAIGKVGRDANGGWILDDCRSAGIDVTRLTSTDEAPTSYSDAMTVQGTGRRTFFHQPGANATLCADDFDLASSPARILYLGYLMLLASLDERDDEGRTGASRVLESAVAAGMRTAVDMVSTADPALRDVVLAALPFTDLLFLNELEASRVLGRPVKANAGSLAGAAAELLGLGVRRAVVAHVADGAVAVTREGERHAHGRVLMPDAMIAGSTGAGDAFAAGFLRAWHEGETLGTCLHEGVCVAASSLTAGSASDGVRPLAACLDLGARHGYLEFALPR